VSESRIFHGLVSFLPARGWLPFQYEPNAIPGANPSKLTLVALESPRGAGRFSVNTIAMPRDMGIFDTNRLRALLDGFVR
jgi:hypothetical protein